jgi:spore germination protein
MIPSKLLFKMAEARGEVPLPTVCEVLMMEIAFETLREAGIRLPSAIGSTLGIVGGIIIGQSAVEAGLVSPLVVIVVALTAICSFAIPNVALVSAYRLVKYFIILMSSVLGFYGFAVSILFILVHLVTLKSFSIPYLYPFVSLTPENSDGLKDSIIKLPIRNMKKRTIFASETQKRRMR